MGDEKFIEGSGWRRHDIKLSLILPPSRNECPASTDITRRGKTPAIPTSIVAGIEYSQASFFAKTFEMSGRCLHSSKPHQLSLSVCVITLRGPVRWIFTIAVSETRTESHNMRNPEMRELVAILPAQWKCGSFSPRNCVSGLYMAPCAGILSLENVCARDILPRVNGTWGVNTACMTKDNALNKLNLEPRLSLMSSFIDDDRRRRRKRERAWV